MTNLTVNQVVKTILEDALQTIIHNTVIQRHHAHKMLLRSLDPTTKLPHCEVCNLPRLLDPPLAPKVRGATSDPPASTTYCDRKPWTRRPGHDIYGNPFLKSDVTGRPLTKKEREAKKKEDEDDNGPPSPLAQDDGSNNTTAPQQKLEKGEKKASKIDEKLRKGEYVPWHTCPSCKRSLLITRFAKHLEQCMGLSGRAASRNAMVKMGGSGNGTPGGSRGGTPGASSQDGGGGGGGGGDKTAGKTREEEDDAEEDDTGKPQGVRKKLLKKGLKEKAKKETSNGKVPKSLSKSNGTSNQRSSPAPSSVGGEGKRERSDEDEEGSASLHVKKRQKLQRVGSVASVVSQSTVGGGGGETMERSESLDGSVVGDGGSFVED